MIKTGWLAVLALGCSTAVGATYDAPSVHADTGKRPAEEVSRYVDAGTEAKSAMGFASMNGHGCNVTNTTVQCEKNWLVTMFCEDGTVWVFDGVEWREKGE